MIKGICRTMKILKVINTYCPKCDTHTEHAASIYKAGKRKGASLGERRQAERKKGYGGQRFPQQRNQAKVTKKQVIQLECKECGYTLQRDGVRIHKIEVAQT
jgi:large subunit ribosomal protein L44e